MKRTGLFYTLLLLAACARAPGDDLPAGPAPPPATLITAVTESMTLDGKLRFLEQELDRVLRAGEIDDRARIRVYLAEAITDRLLDNPPPYTWLAQGYDLEAKVRQLQALADRVVAEVRREEPNDEIFADLTMLRRRVGDLRRDLSVPGRDAPPPLDSLLAGVIVDSIRTRVGEGRSGE